MSKKKPSPRVEALLASKGLTVDAVNEVEAYVRYLYGDPPPRLAKVLPFRKPKKRP